MALLFRVPPGIRRPSSGSVAEARWIPDTVRSPLHFPYFLRPMRHRGWGSGTGNRVWLEARSTSDITFWLYIPQKRAFLALHSSPASIEFFAVRKPIYLQSPQFLNLLPLTATATMPFGLNNPIPTSMRSECRKAARVSYTVESWYAGSCSYGSDRFWDLS